MAEAFRKRWIFLHLVKPMPFTIVVLSFIRLNNCEWLGLRKMKRISRNDPTFVPLIGWTFDEERGTKGWGRYESPLLPNPHSK